MKQSKKPIIFLLGPTAAGKTDWAINWQKQLKNENIDSKVISMPCQELFDLQNEEYQEKILERENCSRIIIEA